MANFVAKFTTKEDKGWGVGPWLVRTNGSSNRHVVGIGVVLQSPKGDMIECEVHLQFPMTNNEVKYEAVLTSLDLFQAVAALSVFIHIDS